jgi:hypothetical protein
MARLVKITGDITLQKINAAFALLHSDLAGQEVEAEATHAVRAYNNANITANSGTSTLITLNSENYDTDGFHSLVTDTSRLVVPAGLGGYYRVTGNVRFAATATVTWRSIRLERNSAGTAAVANIFANGVAHSATNQVVDLTVAGTVYLNAGDYVELFVGTGENTTVLYLDAYYDLPFFEMFRIGP